MHASFYTCDKLGVTSRMIFPLLTNCHTCLDPSLPMERHVLYERLFPGYPAYQPYQPSSFHCEKSRVLNCAHSSCPPLRKHVNLFLLSSCYHERLRHARVWSISRFSPLTV